MNAPAIRASDAEREQVTGVLQRAVAEGRLTPEEGGERLAAAGAARFQDELEQLLRDLPPIPEPVPPVPRGALWLGIAARLTRGVVFAAVMMAVLGFWGLRLLFPLWIVGFAAFAFAMRAGRGRWRGAAYWHGRAWSGTPGRRSMGPSW